MNSRHKRKPIEIAFDSFNILLMILMVVICVYPMLYVLLASLSEPNLLSAHRGLIFKPLGFTLDGYQLVLGNPQIPLGYRNTLIYVAGNWLVGITLTVSFAYVLSRKNFMPRRLLTKMIIVTMFFSGGMIPTYLVVSGLGMIDKIWAIIIPGSLSTMNVIIMRTAFASCPDSLIEAAKIDGANDMTVLMRIMLPLVRPTIAVLSLYLVVGQWNSWFSSSIYLRNKDLFPLQMVLRSILVFSSTEDMMTTLGSKSGLDYSEVIKYACIIVTTIPVLIVYPFLQRYFTSGVMVGALKD